MLATYGTLSDYNNFGTGRIAVIVNHNEDDTEDVTLMSPSSWVNDHYLNILDKYKAVQSDPAAMREGADGTWINWDASETNFNKEAALKGTLCVAVGNFLGNGLPGASAVDLADRSILHRNNPVPNQYFQVLTTVLRF